MKEEDMNKPNRRLSQRIGTYLIANLVLSVWMALVMATPTQLRTGLSLLRDAVLVFFYSGLVAAILVGPLATVEIYLYRKMKGAWYNWTNQARLRPRDFGMSPAERRHWKTEAYRARLSRGEQPSGVHRNRTVLFESNSAAEPVSRALLLMKVADEFERSGKREAADQCYLQITERFANAPQASEAARRLSVAMKA